MNLEQIHSNADSKGTRKVRLTQYRKNAGRWQFFAVARNEDGKPNPEQIIIDGKHVNWDSPSAKFYLDWTDPESGKRIREIAGVGPREASDAWVRRAESSRANSKSTSRLRLSLTTILSMTLSRSSSLK